MGLTISTIVTICIHFSMTEVPTKKYYEHLAIAILLYSPFIITAVIGDISMHK